MWFVYFIESDDWIKVGVTYQLRHRLADIKRVTKANIKLLGYLCETDRKKAYRTETELKQKFFPPLKGAPFESECFPKIKKIYDYIHANCIYYDEIISNLHILSERGILTPKPRIPPLKKQWVPIEYHGEQYYEALPQRVFSLW